MSALTLDNVVVRGLIFHSTVLTSKMMVMALLTSRQKKVKGVNTLFAKAEDMTALTKKANEDDDIQLIRRNHQNDLENIPAFVLAAILYTITNPDCQVALWHFRVFTISRILHTFAFQSSSPQPLRGLAFLTGVLTTGSMLVQSLIAVC